MMTLGRLALGTMAISAALALGVGCDRNDLEHADACPSTEIAARSASANPAAALASNARPDPAPEAAEKPNEQTKKVAAAPARKAPRSSEDAEDVAQQLRVKRLVITRGIEEREPKDATTTFSAEDDRIYAFVEMQNPAREPAAVVVSFEPPGGGAATGNVELAIGPSPRWRTWAFTRGAQQQGEWTAVVRTPGGKVLARESFEVTL